MTPVHHKDVNYSFGCSHTKAAFGILELNSEENFISLTSIPTIVVTGVSPRKGRNPKSEKHRN